MDLNFSAEDQAFAAEVEAFIAANLPPQIRDALRSGDHLDRTAMQAWTRILHARGWAAPGWPAEYGGPGWTPLQRHIFAQALARQWAPAPFPPGVNMVGPVIYTFGTDAQKARFLPRILTLDDWWCQGFSEPGAGSDLASLTTSARRDGDDYLVNGQKTWTTYAQYADWIFLLVRTDRAASKQAGISFLLADMKTPGITVRPILNLEGAHEVNEVFFDDVRIPAANRVGAENEGWACAKFLLAHERTNMARTGVIEARLAQVRERLAAMPAGQTRWRERVAALEVELKALEITQLRVLLDDATPGADSAVASILKIKGSELQQQASELLLDVAGLAGLSDDHGSSTAGRLYFNARKLSIYGGANEIQKSIIAKTILGAGS